MSRCYERDLLGLLNDLLIQPILHNKLNLKAKDGKEI